MIALTIDLQRENGTLTGETAIAANAAAAAASAKGTVDLSIEFNKLL